MKYRISYCMTLSNGSIDVEADSAAEAQHIAEELERGILNDGCEESFVEIEEVLRIEKEKSA